MTVQWPLIFPLIAALVYVAAVLSLKRGAELGAHLWHSSVVSNVLAAVVFQSLLVFGGEWPPLSYFWQPLLVAILFLSGQIWTLYAVQHGDVSIATPMLGLKIFLVAVFTALLAVQQPSWQMWTAAGLSTCGIAALNYSGAHRKGVSVTSTLVSAGIAATSYALFDVLVQKWSPAWGIGYFLPTTIGIVGIISCGLIPFFPRPWSELPQSAQRWLAVGGSLFALQSLLFVSAIGYFGQATAFNVVYSSRGVWSILGVVLVGHWFHSSEKQLGAAVLRWRLLGAALMLMAIVLILV